MNKTSLHKQVENVDVREEKLLGEVKKKELVSRLKGHSFKKTDRHGKYLFGGLDNGGWLVLHFGMTGFLKYFKKNASHNNHFRLVIHFSNGYYLVFDCQRKLGLIDWTDEKEKFIQKKKLGEDPYDDNFDLSRFMKLMDGRRGSIKSALMNQKIISGLGNIYSDEVLFHAGIHPQSEVKKLNYNDLERVFKMIKDVLKTAIEANASPHNMPENYLLQFREKDAPCPVCGGKISTTKITGRTSYFCTHHQNLKK